MGPKLKDTFTIVDQIASKGVIYFKYSNNIYGLELGKQFGKGYAIVCIKGFDLLG